MNIFNKIIVIVLLVLISLFCLFSIINEFAGFIDWSMTGQKILVPGSNINPYIASLALLFIFIISVFLLVLEFFPRKSRIANISSSRSGYTMITIETIEEQVKNTIKKLEGVEDIKIRIESKSKGIIIYMFAKLDEELDLPEKMNEITRKASELVSEKLSIKVLKANLTVVGLSKKEVSGDAKKVKSWKKKTLSSGADKKKSPKEIEVT